MGIFEPYRAIGYITAGVPFSVQRLGTETFITVSIGKAWQIYDCAKLTLALAGPQLPKKIRALASFKNYTFAAYGTQIGVFKRVQQVATWSKHHEKINSLCLLGDHILSSDIKGNIYMWSFKGDGLNLEPVSHIKLENNFVPTCIVHPDTYLNKPNNPQKELLLRPNNGRSYQIVLGTDGNIYLTWDNVIIGSREGSLQLWNISSKKKVYEFKGWDSPVTCCVASPALDIIAVGCADGTIHLHNLRYDKERMSFSHSIRGAVTSLSFRTDGEPLLASGGSSGVISIWNLEKSRLQSVIREAHDASIVSLHFFVNEPVLLSSATDNSIKMWIFDNTDGEARLLRFRSGHSAPPLCIRFYGNGRHILSAGQDRAFRLFSVARDQQSRELSQRHVAKRAKRIRAKEEDIKLKPVIAFDCAEIRERDWCNVVTCHMDTLQAYVWRLQNFVLGEHILTPSSVHQTPIKACAISACGNFAIIGTEGGWIERFNLQSGMSRGNYIDKSEESLTAHDGEVAGIACDATNTLLISAGYHGDVKVWDFKAREVKSRWDVGRSIIKIVFHRANGLLATVADDMVIRLYDVAGQRMVRKFEGHTDRITDVCFSEDGKWLLSSSMDGTIRIWDVILARQIDAMQMDVSVTALSLSPAMDLLATTHVDQNGVFLWVNQAMYSGSINLNNYASGGDVRNVKMPQVSSKEAYDGELNDKELTNQQEIKTEPIFALLDHQIPNLVTLSLLPRSQWQSLTNIDIIKARNKPVEPPKKPEKAPFFLPSIPSFTGEITFKTATDASTEGRDGKGSDLNNGTKKIDLSSQFVKLLQKFAMEKNFSEFTSYLKGLSPSSLDMELRILQILEEDDDPEVLEKKPEFASISLLLDYFIHEISVRNNFEFIQALIKLFLKIHGETVRRHSDLQEKVKKLLEVQNSVWQRIDKMFQSARCMVTFLSNSQF